MRLALLALAALVWIAVPVSARAEGKTDTWDGTSVADKFCRRRRVHKVIPIRLDSSAACVSGEAGE